MQSHVIPYPERCKGRYLLDGWQAYGENPISHGGVSQTVVGGPQINIRLRASCRLSFVYVVIFLKIGLGHLYYLYGTSLELDW
jgi:hypothetical protein